MGDQTIGLGLLDSRILVMILSVFTLTLGFGGIAPILPNYVESFGISHTLMGFFIGSFGLVRLLIDIPSGHISDRYGRKPVMLIGLALFILSGLVAGFANNFEVLLFSRVLQGLGTAFFVSSAVAFIADIAPSDKRAQYMGQFQSGFFLGTATGPAVGGILADLGGIRAPFFGLSVSALVSLVLTHFLVQSAEAGKSSEPVSFGEIGNTIKRMLQTSNGVMVSVTSLVLFVTISGVRITAIPIFGRVALRMTDTEIGIVLSAIAIISFIGVFLLAGLSDRVDRRGSLTLSFAFTGLGIGAYVLATDLSSMLLISIVFGLGTSLIIPSQQALIVEMSDQRHRGLSLGVFRSFNDLGIVIGPLLAGFLFDVYSLGAPFLVISGLCLATSFLTMNLGWRSSGRPQTLQ